MQQNEKTAMQGAVWSQPVLMVRGKPANPWLALLALVFGLFMSLLDITIVNIALPSIQSSLHADLTTVTWVLNAYSLVFAVLLVTMGRLADQYGRKLIFIAGMMKRISCLGLLCLPAA
jgi:MFS family permease